jgi:hypothetical protein
MLRKKQINDIEVKKVNLPKVDVTKIKGYDMIPELYANIYLLARKKQGKTTVLYNIIKNCVDKNTKIYFFVSTIDLDPTYIQILNYLNKHKIEYETFQSLIEDHIEEVKKEVIKTSDKNKKSFSDDNLKNVIDEMKLRILLEKEEDEKEDEESEDDEPKIINFTENENEISFKIKKRKSKNITPHHMLIFDDISDEMRNNRNLKALMKKNRHYKSKIIISTQHFYDVNPDIRKMFDIWILFRDHEDSILQEVYNACSINISFDKFKELYRDATKDPYNFLFVDKNKCEYRQNFNIEYEV